MSIKPRDEIYMTLPSNVPGPTKNTPAEYTTVLPTPIQFTGEWEVALIESHYFNDWRNFNETTFLFTYALKPAESIEIHARYGRSAGDETDGFYDWGPEEEEERQLNDQADGQPQAMTAESPQPTPPKEPPVTATTSTATTSTATSTTATTSTSTTTITTSTTSTGTISTAKVDTPKAPDCENKTDDEKIDDKKEKPAPKKPKISSMPPSVRAHIASYRGLLEKEIDGYVNLVTEVITLPAGYYPTINDLVGLLVKTINDKFKFYKLEYAINPVTGRITFKEDSADACIISTDTYLLSHLGFDATELKLGKEDSDYGIQPMYYNRALGKPQHRPYLHDINTIYVYSDIIDYQIVGNTMATLMGVMPTTTKHGQQESWQFNPLQYIRVPHRMIQSITMKMCTPTGEPVPFYSGDSLCRLHFRRKLL